MCGVLGRCFLVQYLVIIGILLVMCRLGRVVGLGKSCSEITGLGPLLGLWRLWLRLGVMGLGGLYGMGGFGGTLCVFL